MITHGHVIKEPRYFVSGDSSLQAIPVKFDSDRSREREFITFFICHVTLYDHVINRLRDLMDNRLIKININTIYSWQ